MRACGRVRERERGGGEEIVRVQVLRTCVCTREIFGEKANRKEREKERKRNKREGDRKREFMRLCAKKSLVLLYTYKSALVCV